MESLDDKSDLMIYFQNVGSYLSVKMDNYKNTIVKLQNELDTVKYNLNAAESLNESTRVYLCEKNAHIASLEANIKKLEDEKNAFSRVSQIIAMEKENTRLKADLEFMNQRLSKLVAIKGDESHVAVEQTKDEPVYKNKIKGEETKNIYQINDDEQAGSKIGYLQTIVDKDNKEKLKVVWD
jgi:chromosome segregation ATPase